MGCCTSTPLNTTLVYKGTTKHVTGCLYLTALRTRISDLFPDLSDMLFEMVDKDGNNWTQKQYAAVMGQTRDVTVVINRLNPFKFSDAQWETLATSVFRLCNKDRICVSVGFLVTPSLGLTSLEALKSVDPNNLQALR